MDNKDLDYDLAKEFTQATRTHMVNVCTRALVHDMEREAEEGINIPVFLIRDKIEQEAMTQIANAIKYNTINSLYDECWNKVINENLII